MTAFAAVEALAAEVAELDWLDRAGVAKLGRDTRLVALAGRAAQRMADATGQTALPCPPLPSWLSTSPSRGRRMREEPRDPTTDRSSQ